MAYNNPPISWSELERKLSGRPAKPWENPHGDNGPGWSHHREEYLAKDEVKRPDGPVLPYAELHAHSDFSFLDGASDPETLIEEAVRLGLNALALTDHDGFYGAARFAEAAKEYDLSTVYGAELSLELTAAQLGIPDPQGSHLLVLADGVEGYRRLAGVITEAQLRGGEKGKPVYDLEEVAAAHGGHWMILTGCRKGLLRQALRSESGAAAHEAAAAELDRLTALFGLDHVTVELIDHGLPGDSLINDELAVLAADHGLPTIASNNVHYAAPKDYRLASAMAAVRARRSLAEMDGWLPPPTAHLRSGAEMAQRFGRYPGAVRRAADLGRQLAFDLRAAKPRLPKLDVPPGHDPTSWLRELTRRGADQLYPDIREQAQARLDKELAVIAEKGFEGYFLIVRDMVTFAKERGILCQGRGSAANSVVCYTLGITAVDPIRYDLPFERFLATTREEEPDIDVDFDSDRREEVIQEVYRRYGRRNAAQVADVISYRPKSAVRDMAKALGYSPGQQDAWSKQIDSWSTVTDDDDHEIPRPVVELANKLITAPRHLGIHSGGMVLTEQPVGEVVPIEHARMENRTILQWDKDSCAWMGLVKFDFLGLGILSAISHTLAMIDQHLGEHWEFATLPKEEPAVYDMLCRADSVGLFQVESRAQVGTLPRLRPRRFYDLVIEVALIRPGPIQGGAVHPYIRRATGIDPVTYPHPLLQPVLERTKGIPLFQEQLMQIAMTVGGCTGDDADLLRRAMGSKRGVEKIERLRQKLFDGMAANGITGDLAQGIYDRIEAFANFGFAESHALSFALIVYATGWLKLHYPGAYLAGLLRAQPMGFYSPQSLVADARRHGVTVLRPDIVASAVDTGLEPETGPEPVEGPEADVQRTTPFDRLRTSLRQAQVPTGMDSCLDQHQPPVGPFDPGCDDPTPAHRRDGALAVRLGLTTVQGLGEPAATKIVEERERRPFSSINDVVRRAGLTVKQAEALATAGAFDSFGVSRRQALWDAGYADSQDQLEGTAIDAPPPELPGMSITELTLADIWATKISPGEHPIAHLRTELDDLGVVAIKDLFASGPEYDGRRIKVAGMVTHRQRPSTAGGVTFLNLEDETGMLNVICTEVLWKRYRRIARNTAGMIIRGTIEHTDGVTNLSADRLDRLVQVIPRAAQVIPRKYVSRDFR
ncbi:error-prone DNA polymerase [Microlunatus soli]|uniref:Error-prone DNA polymerase n=1 Tax=Microlunatus soli TaxID=630515 RepID=A0A1H2AFB7_9ACTN|nr:error-prone DNA polymerase [Microlunatus soli]SDT44695.1 error-prone DNA polymerase, DnaE-like [Microlunatus soli]